jgi:hypothetical protein
MSRLLIDEAPLTVQPTLAVKIGLNEALFLQQLNYWLNQIEKSKDLNEAQYLTHCKDGKVWVYNRTEDWVRQFPFWSERTLLRIINNLEKKEILLSARYNRKGYDRTKWYTINYTAVDKLENTTTSSSKSPAPPEPPKANMPAPQLDDTPKTSGNMNMPNCHVEENRGVKPSIPLQSANMPDCHDEPAKMATSNMPDCHVPTCQNGNIQPANLASPIPLDYSNSIPSETSPEDNSNEQSESVVINSVEYAAVVSWLKSIGATDRQTSQLIKQYGAKKIKEKLPILLNRQKIHNAMGLLLTALRDDYIVTTTPISGSGANAMPSNTQEPGGAGGDIVETEKKYLQQQLEAQNSNIDAANPFRTFMDRALKKVEGGMA